MTTRANEVRSELCSVDRVLSTISGMVVDVKKG